MTILPSLSEQPAASSQHDEAEVRFSTPKNSSGYFTFRVVVPRALLSKIDDPARIAVIGNPHEGFIIQATRSKEAGTHAINYKTGSGRAVVFTLPFKPSKLNKVERKVVAVKARVRDGKIHTSGMPLEWIAAKSPWIDGPGDSMTPTHHRLSAKPTNGAIQVNGAEPAPVANGNGSPTAPMPKTMPKIGPEVTNDQLRVRLAHTLHMAESLKAELERRTGLKLRVSRDLRNIVVDME